MIAQNRDFSNTIWYTDERFLPCKYRILGRFAHRSFLSPFPSGDSRLCVCKDPRSFVLMPIFERQENTIRKGKAAAALFLAVLCLALLTGCAKKPTKEEQEYEAAMHRFFDTMLEYDALLSGIDPAAPDATEALLTTIDDIEKACVEAASRRQKPMLRWAKRPFVSPVTSDWPDSIITTLFPVKAFTSPPTKPETRNTPPPERSCRRCCGLCRKRSSKKSLLLQRDCQDV